jgi:hypothetical protein
MKKLNLFLFVFLFILSGKIFAQGMTPPPPFESPLFNSMTGTWVSEPYQMMGSTMTDEVNMKMVFNSQFLEADIRSVATSGFIYEGMVIVSPSKDGTITGWSYDVFGKDGITTYTGTWEGKMIYLYGKSAWGTESRVININGDVMIHNVIYKMVDDKGKALPEVTLAITFNKKIN